MGNLLFLVVEQIDRWIDREGGEGERGKERGREGPPF